jgi:creatinine amidohydrolase
MEFAILHTYQYGNPESNLSDIIDSLYVQGFRKMVIVNGHGGNSFKSIVRDLAKAYPDFFIVVVNWYDFIPTSNYFEEFPDEHAGEQETSVMLYYHPEWVKLENAGEGNALPWPINELNKKTGWAPRNWNYTTRDTGIGNPKKSTPEKGERYVQAVVERILKFILFFSVPDCKHVSYEEINLSKFFIFKYCFTRNKLSKRFFC